jgi:hypothetical protein
MGVRVGVIRRGKDITKGLGGWGRGGGGYVGEGGQLMLILPAGLTGHTGWRRWRVVASCPGHQENPLPCNRKHCECVFVCCKCCACAHTGFTFLDNVALSLELSG